MRKCIFTLLSVFSFEVVMAQTVGFLTRNEQNTISSYGSGCLYSLFTNNNEVDRTHTFLINADNIYFLKIEGRIMLLTLKRVSRNKSKIVSENHMYKVKINLTEENNGTIDIFDKKYSEIKKNKVVFNTKFSRSCGD